MGHAFSTISTNSKSTKATGNIDFQYNDSSVYLQLVNNRFEVTIDTSRLDTSQFPTEYQTLGVNTNFIITKTYPSAYPNLSPGDIVFTNTSSTTNILISPKTSKTITLGLNSNAIATIKEVRKITSTGRLFILIPLNLYDVNLGIPIPLDIPEVDPINPYNGHHFQSKTLDSSNPFYNHELKYMGIKKGGEMCLENRATTSATVLSTFYTPKYPYYELPNLSYTEGDIVNFTPHISDNKHFLVHKDTVSPGKLPLEFVEIWDFTDNKIYLISTKCIAKNANYYDVALGYVHYGEETPNPVVVKDNIYTPIFMTPNIWEAIVLNHANIEGLPIYTNNPDDHSLTEEDFNNAHNKIWNWAGIYTMATDTSNGAYGENIYTLGNYYADFKRDLKSSGVLDTPSYHYDNLAFRPVLIKDLTEKDYIPTINGKTSSSIDLGEVTSSLTFYNVKIDTKGLPSTLTYSINGTEVPEATTSINSNVTELNNMIPQSVSILAKPNSLNNITMTLNNGRGTASILMYFTSKIYILNINGYKGYPNKYMGSLGDIYDDYSNKGYTLSLPQISGLNQSYLPKEFNVRVEVSDPKNTYDINNRYTNPLENVIVLNKANSHKYVYYTDNEGTTYYNYQTESNGTDSIGNTLTFYPEVTRELLCKLYDKVHSHELFIKIMIESKKIGTNVVSHSFNVVNPIGIKVANDTITSLKTNTINYQLTTENTKGETVYVTESLNGKVIRENFEVQMETYHEPPKDITLTIPQEDFDALKPNSQHTISIVVKRQLNGAPTTYELDTVKQDIIFNKDLNPPTVDISSINNLTFSFTCKSGVGEANQNIIKVDIVLRNRILKTFGQSEVSSTMTYTVSRDNLEAGDNEILIKVYTDSNIQGDARINAKYTPIKNILNNDIIIIGNTPYVVRGVENFADTHTLILDKPTTVKTGQHLDVLGKGVNVKVKSNEVEYPLTLITSSKLLDGKIEDKYTSDLPNVENVTLVLNINEDLTIHQLQEAFNYKEGSEV